MINRRLTLGILLIVILIPIAVVAEEKFTLSKQPGPSTTITLEQAVAKVLIHNPTLKVYSLEERVREAKIIQAGKYPNPSFNFNLENFLGSGNFSGFQSSETTVRLSQLVELGGKRAARIQASSRSRELSKWDYEAKRVDVLTMTANAFTDLLKAQRLVSLNEELVLLSKQVSKAVSERVEAGKVSPIDKTKADVELSKRRIGLARAMNNSDIARRNLAVGWAETEPKFNYALGNYEAISTVPSLKSLMQKIENNPDVARWATELSQRQALVDVEKSKAIPNVKFNAAVRHLAPTNDNALVMGFTVPLPLFNKNEGNIAAARHRAEKAEAQKSAFIIQLKNKLATSHKKLTLAYSEVVFLKTKIIPGTQSAFDAMTEGYRFGKFGFLDLLESQRTLFDARMQYIEALGTYHKSFTEMERLIGDPQGKPYITVNKKK
jgi:cobalt-zinc-cadmium efflux system outer membrane protein